MSIGLSTIIWIIALGALSQLVIIWGLYKLVSFFRNRRDAPIASPESSGFEITIKSVEPVIKGNKSNNFMTILERLTNEDDELEKELKERRKEEASKRNAAYTASSSGIEADSSDETASQTFIGQDPGATPDPGRIQLGLIKAQDPDLASDA